MPDRLVRINENLRVETGKLIRSEVELEGDALITVVRVETSPTLEHATVYVSVLPEAAGPAALRVLHAQIYPLQQALNRRLVMRPVPKIRFVLDNTEAHAAEIEKIISEVVG